MGEKVKKTAYDQFFTKAREAKRPKTSDKIVRSHLNGQEERLRDSMRMRKTKARPPLPWKAVVGLFVSVAALSSYLLFPSSYERLFERIEISALGRASAADKVGDSEKGGTSADTPAGKSQPNSAQAEKSAATEAGGGKTKGSVEKSNVEEEFSHFEKLKQRKEELDTREKDLTELEEELQRQKVELDKRIAQLEEMRNQIAKTLKDRVEVDQEKVNKLVDLYSNMKPKQAADVIGSLNEELAVEVLAKMKKKNAAEIMNLLPPEKARVLSEKYTGYRRISSQEPKG